MKKISKQKILEASIDVIKKYGYEKLSIRNIAKQLGCSTQPIYSEFSDKNELEDAVYQEAQKHHKKYAEQLAKNLNIMPYMAVGMGFVKFAKQEKQLFRFLYMQNKWSATNESYDYDKIIEKIKTTHNLSSKEAVALHGDMTIYAYGLAMLENLGMTNFSDEEISQRFEVEFGALKANLIKKIRKKGVLDEKYC